MSAISDRFGKRKKRDRGSGSGNASPTEHTFGDGFEDDFWGGKENPPGDEDNQAEDNQAEDENTGGKAELKDSFAALFGALRKRSGKAGKEQPADDASLTDQPAGDGFIVEFNDEFNDGFSDGFDDDFGDRTEYPPGDEDDQEEGKNARGKAGLKDSFAALFGALRERFAKIGKNRDGSGDNFPADDHAGDGFNDEFNEDFGDGTKNARGKAGLKDSFAALYRALRERFAKVGKERPAGVDGSDASFAEEFDSSLDERAGQTPTAADDGFDDEFSPTEGVLTFSDRSQRPGAAASFRAHAPERNAAQIPYGMPEMPDAGFPADAGDGVPEPLPASDRQPYEPDDSYTPYDPYSPYATYDPGLEEALLYIQAGNHAAEEPYHEEGSEFPDEKREAPYQATEAPYHEEETPYHEEESPYDEKEEAPDDRAVVTDGLFGALGDAWMQFRRRLPSFRPKVYIPRASDYRPEQDGIQAPSLAADIQKLLDERNKPGETEQEYERMRSYISTVNTDTRLRPGDIKAPDNLGEIRAAQDELYDLIDMISSDNDRQRRMIGVYEQPPEEDPYNFRGINDNRQFYADMEAYSFDMNTAYGFDSEEKFDPARKAAYQRAYERQTHGAPKRPPRFSARGREYDGGAPDAWETPNAPFMPYTPGNDAASDGFRPHRPAAFTPAGGRSNSEDGRFRDRSSGRSRPQDGRSDSEGGGFRDRFGGGRNDSEDGGFRDRFGGGEAGNGYTPSDGETDDGFGRNAFDDFFQ